MEENYYVEIQDGYPEKLDWFRVHHVYPRKKAAMESPTSQRCTKMKVPWRVVKVTILEHAVYTHDVDTDEA